MIGQPALERVNRVEVRSGWWRSSNAPDDQPTDGSGGEIDELGGDSADRLWRNRWNDQLEWLRQTWVQTTFYVFDNDRWL
jgi:hypothetical protein